MKEIFKEREGEGEVGMGGGVGRTHLQTRIQFSP